MMGYAIVVNENMYDARAQCPLPIPGGVSMRLPACLMPTPPPAHPAAALAAALLAATLCACGGGGSKSPPNPMSLKAYKATMPEGPHDFVVDAELSDLFHDRWRESRQSHYAARLSDADRHSDSVIGYAPRDSEAGRALFARLSDGKSHRLTARVRYASANSSYVEILAVADRGR